MFENPVDVTLWFAAVVGLVWACLPALIHLCGGSILSHHVVTDSEPSNDSAIVAIEKQLVEIGFRLLGEMTTTIWFLHSHWRWRVRHHVFFMPSCGCFAKIYRLRSGEPLRVTLATCFSDCSLVETANHLSGLLIVEANHVRSGLVTNDFRELVDFHRETVERFAKSSHVPVSDGELSTLATTEDGFDRQSLREKQTPMYVLSRFGIGCLLSFLLVARSALPFSRMLALALILGAISRLVFDHMILKTLLAHRRREVSSASS
jgi:hypothetical protein